MTEIKYSWMNPDSSCLDYLDEIFDSLEEVKKDIDLYKGYHRDYYASKGGTQPFKYRIYKLTIETIEEHESDRT